MTRHPSFVHLTDLHVGDPDFADTRLYSTTDAMLVTILEQVKRVQPAPDFVVVSGDLTNRGDVASFAHLKRIFDDAALAMPVIWALGNHDSREGFYRGMLGRDTDLDAPYFHDQSIAGVHVITLDSSAPYTVGGTIEPEQFDWLERALTRHPERPKLIVCHHPPALDEDDLTMEWKAINGADTIRLRETLAGHNVLGFLSGHIHFDRVTSWNGIPVVVGMGQHAATDVLYLHEGLRMLTGASFAIGTVRPSGLTISFVPQPSERRELRCYTHAEMREMLKHYETPPNETPLLAEAAAQAAE